MPSGLLILALALLAGRVTADGLRDHPIAGGELTYLDGTWTAKSDAGHEIAAQVPGDLLTDLQTAGLIGDPLYELNFKNASLWNERTWTFSTTFATPAFADADLRVRPSPQAWPKSRPPARP